VSVELIEGDCRDVLAEMPEQSINCIVTSPPYFGLRDYGHGDQIGLEPTPAEFVEALVGVMRLARRVLRDDGTLWLNLGDSYARAPAKGGSGPGGKNEQRWGYGEAQGRKFRPGSGRADGVVDARGQRNRNGVGPVPGLKDKDLIGIPWRVAFALQADGWYLRQDIIWHKPNPMPESVRDRCTKAHEYVFLLSKNERYYFDADAIAEPSVTSERPQLKRALALAAEHGLTDAHIAAIRSCGVSDVGKAQVTQSGYGKNLPEVQALADEAKAVLKGYYREFLTADNGMRNKRDVWTIPTKGFKGAHFATFPEALVEPCILAGCPVGGTVLDPFGGSGTVGVVARRHGRNATLIELNPEYYDIASERLWPTAVKEAAE
jgi:DNA modification methylase